jgi:hydroxymethylpyrimidine/phosphomethylpyrimidine kinase
VTPRVVVIGGLDPCGGAGISADARTLLAHGCEALPVAAVIAVQNRFGMQRVEVLEEALVLAQLRAALDDGGIAAVKTGLLGSASMVRAVAQWLQRFAPPVPVVVDPVLSATAGGYACAAQVAEAYRETLAPLAAMFTPNEPELVAVLAGSPVLALLDAGCAAVLHKGGHGPGDVLVDRLLRCGGEQQFAHRRIAVGPVHGTGCALASAIAAHLAHGRPLAMAAERAVAWLQRCLATLSPLENASSVGSLPRPLPILHADAS